MKIDFCFFRREFSAGGKGQAVCLTHRTGTGMAMAFQAFAMLRDHVPQLCALAGQPMVM